MLVQNSVTALRWIWKFEPNSKLNQKENSVCVFFHRNFNGFDQATAFKKHCTMEPLKSYWPEWVLQVNCGQIVQLLCWTGFHFRPPRSMNTLGWKQETSHLKFEWQMNTKVSWKIADWSLPCFLVCGIYY